MESTRHFQTLRSWQIIADLVTVRTQKKQKFKEIAKINKKNKKDCKSY